MKIAINTRFLADKNLEGFARFIYETTRRMVDRHPEDQFYFLFDRKSYDKSFIFGTNVKPIVVPPQARHPYLWYIWYEWTSKRALRKIKPDVYLSPDGLNSTSLPFPSVTVIHDIGFEKLEDQLPATVEKYYRKMTPRIISGSDRVVTVSEFSKKEICSTYSINPDKVDVVHNGFTSNFKPLTQEEKEKICKEYSEGQPYFLFVGSIHPRKNIERLIGAFEMFKEQTGSPMKLFLAGRWAWKSEDIREKYQQSAYKEDIVATGYISEKTLGKLMSGARAFCYLSLYEGFGIPILEAMAAGIPVVTSSISSMPEVAGDAALYADPMDEKDMSRQMQRLATDEKLRHQLIEKGFERINHFDWDRSADQLYHILKELVSKKA
ncbi:MAG TPA: glycosyltransferase family 1 protein [Saprospiraceae bacterium]|nr:glycosyltransferase family 1 protein [Saprospiraceae bacterium]